MGGATIPPAFSTFEHESDFLELKTEKKTVNILKIQSESDPSVSFRKYEPNLNILRMMKFF